MSVWDKMIRFDYAHDLHKHLKGFENGAYTGSSIYQPVLLVSAVLTVVFIANFYYGIFNRPKFSSFWVWVLNILLSSGITFGYALMRTTSDLNKGNYDQVLRFTQADCMLFGFTAAIYTLISSFGLSFLIKWWSLNNSRIPI